MGSEAPTFAPARVWPILQSRLADAAFVIFLLLVFIGLQPFAPRDPLALAAGESGFGGSGDLVRQIAYLGAFVLILIAAVRASGFRAVLCVPPLFAALLAWCALSSVWAGAPDVVFRRASLEIVIVFSAMMGVSMLGTERSLALTRGVLALVLVINWLSIPLVHNAVHLPGEIDPQLVGDWRGVFFHKNIAGSVSAITAILFFFQAWNSRRLLDWALFLAALGFTLMTGSKSSLGLLPLALAAGCVYRFVWRRGIDRAIVCVGSMLVAVAVAAVVAANANFILHALENPTEFTGRTVIWQAEIAFVRDHFLLGSGFGSFSDTGVASPLHNYVADAWVQNISHGHNAYLQLLVTIGVIGFLLAMAVLVADPALALWRLDPPNVRIKSVLTAVFVFMLLHNFLESDFLEGDGPAWVAFLVLLAALRELGPAVGFRAAGSSR